MKIRAEFFADLRDKVGAASRDVILNGETVLDLIERLDGIFSGKFRDLMVQGDGLKDLIKILVNGIDIRGLNGLQTRLKEGDVVAFFPPVAGG